MHMHEEAVALHTVCLAGNRCIEPRCRSIFDPNHQVTLHSTSIAPAGITPRRAYICMSSTAYHLHGYRRMTSSGCTPHGGAIRAASIRVFVVCAASMPREPHEDWAIRAVVVALLVQQVGDGCLHRAVIGLGRWLRVH